VEGMFRKISRVGSLAGGTKWYLSHDCLLAAKRKMYVVEYRRFYLRDLESIVVWPSRSWWLRVTIPAMLPAALGASLWAWVNATAGEIFIAIGVAWVLLELALGPTALSYIRTTGASVDLRLVKRTRRARKVLAIIDDAVRASRDVPAQPAVAHATSQSVAASVATNSQAAAAAPSIAAATQTNAS